MLHAVKFNGQPTKLRGLALPYGGIHGGRDRDGEAFGPETDFSLDWFDSRPVLYEHGMSAAGPAVVGRQTGWERGPDGIHATMALDTASPYYKRIVGEVAAGKLFLSSGAMSHLVQKRSDGRLTRWPWVELSLVHSPANELAVVSVDEASKRFKLAGLKFSLPAGAEAPAQRHYRETPPEEVDRWVRWRSEAAVADCARERGIYKPIKIVYVREEDYVEEHDRQVYERQGVKAWRSWPSATALRGFYLSQDPDEAYTVFVGSEQDEWEAAEVAAHEVHHLAEVQQWGETDEASERRATAYGQAYREHALYGAPGDSWGRR